MILSTSVVKRESKSFTTNSYSPLRTVSIIPMKLLISISEFCSRTPNSPGIASVTTLDIRDDAASSNGGNT